MYKYKFYILKKPAKTYLSNDYNFVLFYEIQQTLRTFITLHASLQNKNITTSSTKEKFADLLISKC